MAIVLLFAASISWLFIDNAVHLDEAYFWAVARHILADPLHPLDFPFNWFGRSAPASALNVHPPLPSYWLALALRLAGGSERAARLCCVPFDLAAAAGLYLLAERFLSEPLLPVLIVMACPAYLVNMPHLMGEKWIGAFGFPGLYALARALDEDDRRWYWASAALVGAALLSKYSAVFLLPVAGVYGLRRGVPARRLLGYLAVAGLPAAAAIGWGAGPASGNARLILKAIHFTAGLPQSRWPHRLRSLLAFTGGCGAVTAAWPYFLLPRILALASLSRPRPEGGRERLLGRLAAGRRRWLVLCCLGAALALVAVLFSPFLDAGAARWEDRALGDLLAFGAILSVGMCFTPEFRAGPPGARGEAPFIGRGAELWLPWIVAVAVLQFWAYWSVVARFILFLIPAVVFAWAGYLETRLPRGGLTALYGASLAATLTLSLALACADARYAAAQRDAARLVAQPYIAKGRRVWFTGHWGLQHYLEAAGARGLDVDRGGWDEVKPGDVVIVPEVNTNILRPPRPVLADVRSLRIDFPAPLRLLSGDDRVQAGFYSSMRGFLPFAFSRRHLEEISILEVL